MRDRYDVIVIGGGHAGVEAAWAAAAALSSHGRDAHSTAENSGWVALITMDPSRIGQMSCNPAIGGLGKGQIVREIDALGGLMGLAIDATGIMFKMLNTSKGAAVHGPRAQADKYAYAAEVQRLISTRNNIDVIAGTVDDLVVHNGKIISVVLPGGCGIVKPNYQNIQHNLACDKLAEMVYPAQPSEESRSLKQQTISSSAVVLTTGTFMRALMHTGTKKTQGGRINEGAAVGISATLKRLGFELGRLKTGTPPRLAKESLDWDSLDKQIGDDLPVAFSDLSPQALSANRFPVLEQTQCRLTSTTAKIHELIRANLHQAPMYSGQIEADSGPRYCPSIEDKIVRFAQRESHHVFLEPESLFTNEIYCNGISTSLPVDIQEKFVRMMPGCEQAEILRFGYAVEYDMVWPHQIDSTCMTKSVHGLFFAGQINCTTGYEEAGGQGLVAGLNAARLVNNQDPIRLRRDQAYIGVMLDDLVTKTPREPYRMFTSRAEHRLLLRADNADERLTGLGRELGLVDDQRFNAFENRQIELEQIRKQFDQVLVEGKSLKQLVRRPDFLIEQVADYLNGEHKRLLIARVVNESRYEGYIVRQHAEIKRQQKAEGRSIPDWLDFQSIDGLRAEASLTLARFMPTTMGQASRLSGVNPADLTLVAVAIRRGPKQLPSPAVY
ncbi:MAG: tRNA uridine-5-carboxymethylaminomethyl(34) synthesis enzyme MnmG [Planctomycetes bacterium]|nr:tRNA uridine-5-carboxymethylaminomethyl(34) synthesis enzyme MnmG [Planctomycetota bacterium]